MKASKHRTRFPVEFEPDLERSDGSDRRRETIVDDDQVVVRIKRQLAGIERTFGLRGRTREFLGEGPRHNQGRRTKGHAACKEPAARGKIVRRIHNAPEVDRDQEVEPRKSHTVSRCAIRRNKFPYGSSGDDPVAV